MPITTTQSGITATFQTRFGADVKGSGTSTDPDGSCYQVYLNGRLVWAGAKRWCVVAPPPPVASDRGPSVDVMRVDPSELWTDHTAYLPTPPGGGSTASLYWFGGTDLSPDIERYDIYMGPSPGAAADMTKPVATVAAYGPDGPADGAGYGWSGLGGAGASSSTYSWQSGALSGGTWHFAVVGVDAFGQRGDPLAFAVPVTGLEKVAL